MFAECPYMESVTIGNDVTIGDMAFFTNRNYNLMARSWQEGNKTFVQYVFDSPIKKVTIGNNAIIGKSAFQNAAGLTKVTLGENAEIGNQAFYNCEALVDIDLSKAKSIGEMAFAGDTYYICQDKSMSTPAIKDGRYMIQYTAPAFTAVDLSSAQSVGSMAFAFCRSLTSVKLSDAITEIPERAFYSCIALDDINLGKVEIIGDQAFVESAMTTADLSSVTEIGSYAFMANEKLTSVILNTNGTIIKAAAFANCVELTEMQNMEFVTEIHELAFAYAGITEADLSAAVKIGDNAFIKHLYVCENCGQRTGTKADECSKCHEKGTQVAERITFTVKLGSALEELGDNPFAYCQIAPFSNFETVEFNGIEYTNETFNFQISEKVYVVDGNLYCVLPNGGLELIAYTGRNTGDIKVAADTYRISAYAFAGTDAEMVILPYTVRSIGHKAFFACTDLKVVVFTSYEAPILEEEFDQSYYVSYQNLPGTGEYGGYVDYEGNDFTMGTLEIIPYYMWNLSEQIVYYGANFVDYIGHIDNKIMMVRPSNGQHYGTFIHEQYFDLIVDGSVAAQNATLAAIAAINQIPERVELIHEEIVLAARAAYNKVATLDQQALVSNFQKLQKAEQRLKQLKANEQKCACGQNCGCQAGCVCGETCCENCGCMTGTVTPPAPVDAWMIIAIVALCLVVVAGIVIVVLVTRMRKTDDVVEEIPAAEEAAEETKVEEEASAETETEEKSETETE
jgi:hypothetical protein